MRYLIISLFFLTIILLECVLFAPKIMIARTEDRICMLYQVRLTLSSFFQIELILSN